MDKFPQMDNNELLVTVGGGDQDSKPRTKWYNLDVSVDISETVHGRKSVFIKVNKPSSIRINQVLSGSLLLPKEQIYRLSDCQLTS